MYETYAAGGNDQASKKIAYDTNASAYGDTAFVRNAVCPSRRTMDAA
jgi:hypothetical protein